MRCDRNRQGGGVAIYVKDTISYKIRDDLPIGDFEIVCIEVQLRCSSPFIVLAWYRPPNYNKLRLIELEQILQILDSENMEIILLGDTNCDELCTDTKNNITKLLESIYCNYQFKQTIKMSTRVTNKTSTLIDHSAANRPSRIVKSDILITGFSDHDMVFGMRKISGNRNKAPKIIRSRNLKHYNKEAFRKDLANADWESIMEVSDVNIMYAEWEKLFINILDKHAPIRQRKVRNKYSPHINAELKRKMFLRDFYKKKHRSSGNPNDWLEYKKLRNIVNIEHANAKKDYFAHKLSQTNHDIKETWKILNSALGRRSKTTTIQRLRVNGTNLTEPDKISEQFNKNFCNIASDILKESEEFDSSDISFESYITKLPKTTSSFRFKRISPADVLHHVGKLKSSRSGAIPTRFLKDGINQVANSLSFLYYRSTEEGTFPSNLRIASVCPIYKGEGHKDNPNNYRPISILHLIARVFEKIIHIQLFRYLESTIFKYQSGFGPKHSTESSVINSTKRWLLNIDQGNYNIAVFVDLKKAFNTVNHEILLNKLRYYGIDNTELKWFSSYLTDRKQYTVVDGAMSSESNINHGVPQGS